MSGAAPEPRLCVVYDGTCPLCRGAARVGGAVDRGRTTRWVAAGAEGTPDGADPAEEGSVLVWDGGDAPLRRTAALAAVLATWPVAGGALAALVRRSGRRGDVVYDWVARHRRLLRRPRRGRRPPRSE